MKKIFLILTIAALAFTVTACGREEIKPVGMPNPLTEVTAQELLEKTGFCFELPESAEDVHYFTLEAEKLTAQMTFKLDGNKIMCRAIPDGIPENGEIKDISGMYYEWKTVENVKVFHSDAIAKLSGGGQGCIGWYDYAPGITYSVSMDSGAAVEELTRIAEICCPPVQGDVG